MPYQPYQDTGIGDHPGQPVKDRVGVQYQRQHRQADAGIEEVKDNLATKMSGGQQQRTAIARALMNNPKILLADEPTGNLDTEASDKVYNLFRDINEEFRNTIIVITHERRIAEKTDRIIEIRDGRIHLDLYK